MGEAVKTAFVDYSTMSTSNNASDTNSIVPLLQRPGTLFEVKGAQFVTTGFNSGEEIGTRRIDSLSRDLLPKEGLEQAWINGNLELLRTYNKSADVPVNRITLANLIDYIEQVSDDTNVPLPDDIQEALTDAKASLED
ncbi:hypothetical protein RH831_10725 [Halodesulfurarchaeum sp. HSR-GB]|uniref:hypothetical protein n=1 Tax=Halodesulfurarchaeum sp. HSR-GB TaxID=3074077 RepID=UPI002866CB9B|nr:hypothetical protein [Halodesulfurarchaeum sp. HSR-GB]MDR5657649.1 hypothetical protein [Halodesulfurarchaeum sp. HSR-GB]